LPLRGVAGAFRRSELVALDVADLEETEEGMRVAIRRSKTDQEGSWNGAGHDTTTARELLATLLQSQELHEQNREIISRELGQ
jgi:hypothetical protein